MNVEIGTSMMVGSGTTREAPRVVEIVGPAGAGKTTLCQALLRSSARARRGSFPDVRSLNAAPFFLWNGLHVMPSIRRFSPRGSRRPTAREFAWLCILNGWPRVLQSEWGAQHQTALLDQGPVYLFSELRESGPLSFRSQRSNGTWQALYKQWAATLGAIVWLDAPDDILTQRIRAREKAHMVKAQPDRVVSDFIHRFRNAYEYTVSTFLSCNPSLLVLRFETSMHTPDEIARDVTAALNL